MDDVKKLLERQAVWQKGRKSLPWPEKIRIAEAIRESILQLRSTGPGLRVKKVPDTFSSPKPTAGSAIRGLSGQKGS